MPYEFDHAVILVPDLEQGINQFTALGFHVEKGGSHGLTENALIPFKDQTYIELIAYKSKPAKFILMAIHKWLRLRRSHDTIMSRLTHWFSRPFGPIDWCVRYTASGNPKHLPAGMTIPKEFSRLKPDGTQIKWTLSAPRNFALPMLIDDRTERRFRAPLYKSGLHKNGAEAIEEIILPPENIHAIVQGFEGLSAKQDGVKLAPSDKINLDYPFGLKIKFKERDQNLMSYDPIIDIPVWLVSTSLDT